MEEITNVAESEDIRELTVQEQIDTLDKQHKSMLEKRIEKMINAKAYLEQDISMYAEKLLTANGLMNALNTLRSITDGYKDVTEEIAVAASIAQRAASRIIVFYEHVRDMNIADFQVHCGQYGHLLEDEGMYASPFITADLHVSPEDLAVELIMLQFCSTVGPSLDDISNFYNSANDEIFSINDKIQELKASLEE